MARQLPRKKGDALEDAVRAIENAILSAAPGYAEGTFAIQGKRIFNAGGVRHEVDIHVTASLPVGYDAVFIFECKNWSSKVGKNELIVFSEKIAMAGAQRGFFVAASFTRDARAQAKKDQRIQLLTASHFEPVTRVEFPQLHLLNIGATEAQVTFTGFGTKPVRQLDLNGQIFTVNGQAHPAPEYMNQLTAKIRDSHMKRLASDSMSEGRHKVSFADVVDFEAGEALLGNAPIKCVAVKGVTDISLTLGSVLSVFEVETRGRLLVVGASCNGIELRAEVVQITNRKR